MLLIGKAWLTSFALMQCLLIMTLYQSLFRASTIVGRFHAPFKTFDEVIVKVESGRYRITQYAEGDWYVPLVSN